MERAHIVKEAVPVSTMLRKLPWRRIVPFLYGAGTSAAAQYTAAGGEMPNTPAKAVLPLVAGALSAYGKAPTARVIAPFAVGTLAGYGQRASTAAGRALGGRSGGADDVFYHVGHAVTDPVDYADAVVAPYLRRTFPELTDPDVFRDDVVLPAVRSTIEDDIKPEAQRLARDYVGPILRDMGEGALRAGLAGTGGGLVGYLLAKGLLPQVKVDRYPAYWPGGYAGLVTQDALDDYSRRSARRESIARLIGGVSAIGAAGMASGAIPYWARELKAKLRE